MKTERISAKKIKLEITIQASIDELWDMISQPYKMSLWLGNQVRKTSKGFDVTINLPLYDINLHATIMRQIQKKMFEFRWDSEYVMDTSIITIHLDETDAGIRIIVEEVGNFDESRWSDPQSIHIDLWKQALNRLSDQF